MASPVSFLSAPACHRAWPRRALDALLYGSIWLAAAAAAQTAAAWRQLAPAGPLPIGAGRLALMVFGATLLVYNLDAALPFKQGQPAGASGRKAWQQRHRRQLATLAGGAAVLATGLFVADGWWHYLPGLLPLAALALLYSWPLGRRGALREVPLLKVFLIAGVWAAITVGLPALALGRPLAAAAPLLGQRFGLVLALAVVFDIRDVSRDQAAGLRTLPVLLGVRSARAVALAALAASVMLGLGRGAPALAVLAPALLAALVICLARESRGDYFFALLTDGVLLVVAAAGWVG